MSQMKVRRVSWPTAVRWAVISTIWVVAGSGCGPYLTEFRDVSGASVQSGVLSVLTGVVDGIFAVYTPDNPA